MSAYLFAKLTVTDPSWLPEYTEHVTKQLADIGATYRVRSMDDVVLEGDIPEPTAVVLIEFPSMDVAKEWYHSDEYAEAKAIRISASTSVQTIIEGL